MSEQQNVSGLDVGPGSDQDTPLDGGVGGTQPVSETAEQGGGETTPEGTGTEVPSGETVENVPTDEIAAAGVQEDAKPEESYADKGEPEKPEWNVETHGPAPKESAHLYNVVGGDSE